MERINISDLKIKDVFEDGATFDVLHPVIHPDFEKDRRNEQEQYIDSAKRFLRPDCFNYTDDDFPGSDPHKSFQLLATKMTNLIPSGKIKKRIIREGYGDVPKISTTVKIHYNAYTEHDGIPFDSTYTRNQMFSITIGDGGVIRGLEIAVQSMRMNEKAEFLMEPEYAYKDSGLNRIKPNSVVLFEVEIFDIQSTSIKNSDNDDENNDFEHVYKLCNELRIQANSLFKVGNYNGAIQRYNKAVRLLEDVVLRDINDQDKSEDLLVKLHINLLVCYTKLGLPKKGCLNANKIYYLVEGKHQPLPAKVFFNEAKCLRMLGEYDRALSKLKVAKSKEPNHQNIIEEIELIEKAKRNSKKRDEAFDRVYHSKKRQESDHLAQSNLDCITIVDEDTLEEGTPFELLAKKMENLVLSGDIKKRILREGDGDKPEDLARVKIHYNAYGEFCDEPFDSTYQRKRPQCFTINRGDVIPGLDIGVQSMKLNEKSQFLISPEFAYKCIVGRVPTTTVLFEVELIEIINLGFQTEFEKLPKEEQDKFENVLKYCSALCVRGKDEYSADKYDKAIISFNTALNKLDETVVEDRYDLKMHREMNLRLLSNLLVCQAKVKPRKGLKTAQQIYKLTDDGVIMKIPAKVYFQHSKCLRLVNQLEEAKVALEKAKALAPKNEEIAIEFLLLQREIEDEKKVRSELYKSVIP